MDKQTIAEFISEMNTNPEARKDSIISVERKIGLQLPMEYIDFLNLSNGAEGFIGSESYVMFWSVEDIIPQNVGYQVQEFAPGLLLFGSNGGGLAYAFDTREESMPVVEVPFVGMSVEEAKLCAYTFLDFLKYLYENK